MPESDVAIATAPNRAIAEMWAELLRAEGIACRVIPVNVGSSIYEAFEGEMAVVVRASDAERARDVVPGRL